MLEAFVRDARQRLDVDAEGLWVVRGEQAEGVGQEEDGASVVVAEDVVEAGGDLDDALVEVGELSLRRGAACRALPGLAAAPQPDVLEGLMAVVEAPGVELLDGLREGVESGSGGHGYRVGQRGQEGQGRGVRESGGQMGQRGQEG